MDYSISDFYDYVVKQIIGNNLKMGQKSNEYDFLPRDARRRIKENIFSDKKPSNKIKNLISDLISISKSIDSDLFPLNTEREYSSLIISIFGFFEEKYGKSNFDKIFTANDEKNINIRKSIISDANKLLSYFVIRSKNKNIHLNFLNCFLNDGSINIDKFDTFEKFIEYASNTSENNSIHKEPKKLFISDELLERAKQRKKEILEEKKKFKEEKKNHKFKETKSIDKKEENIVSSSKPKELSETEKNIYANYIDERSLELKNDVVSKISLNDFLDLISVLDGMSKKRLEYYAGEYYRQYFGKQLDRISDLLEKEDLKRLRTIISAKSGDNLTIRNNIYDFVLSEDYQYLNDEDIKDNILELLNYDLENIESNNEEVNLVVFPSETFFEDEVNTILNISKSGYKKDFFFFFLNQQITCLRTQNIEEMYGKGSDTFHSIKDSDAKKDLVIKGYLKGYRYGNRRPKVSFFRIGVSEKNKNMLKEKYNLKEIPDVLLSFTLGFVPIEEEHAMYARSCRSARAIEDKLDYIAQLFKNDFTDETFKEACYYIDMSLEQINKKNEEEMVR